MVDCSGCEWKQEMNSLSCKKNNIDVGWINCDYRCTPFSGDEFNNNYFGNEFRTEFFCGGPTTIETCEEKNILLKTSYNSFDDICVFNNDNNICEISTNVSLNDYISDSNIYSKTNNFIYNENILDENNNLININDSNFRNTFNNSSAVSSCTIDTFYEENNCSNKPINICEEHEGCAYNFITENCENKNLVLPSIDFLRYYNDFYTVSLDSNVFNIIYQRYQRLREIRNWPCLKTDIDYPINCSNESQFEKMYIKNQYLGTNDDGQETYIDLNVSADVLLYDKNMLIELINQRCFISTGEGICPQFQEEAKLENIELYARIIRDNTLSVFNELLFYTFDKLPYILLIEFQLFLDNLENYEGGEQQTGDLRDLNNLQLYPERTDYLIENLRDNDKFRGCLNDLFYIENENELFNYILYNSLVNWQEIHFNYIKQKIDRFIEIGPHSVNGCFRLLGNINENICRGEITTGIISLMLLVGEIIGVQIDLKNIDQDHPNFMKLINTIIPQIPHIVKKITDLSKYYEENNCGEMANNSKILLEIYNKILQPNKPVVNYHLFDNIFGNFFSDFVVGNIYKKIILLIFIYLILTKIIDIFKKK